MSLLVFKVQDMTCAHCVATINQALKSLDPDLRCEFDLDEHELRVESALSAERVAAAITKAGFTPALASPA